MAKWGTNGNGCQCGESMGRITKWGTDEKDDFKGEMGGQGRFSLVKDGLEEGVRKGDGEIRKNGLK